MGLSSPRALPPACFFVFTSLLDTSGDVSVSTGVGKINSGSVEISTGNAAEASGSVTISAGDAGSGAAGGVQFSAGSSSAAAGGSVHIKAGTGITQGGDVAMSTGSSSAGRSGSMAFTTSDNFGTGSIAKQSIYLFENGDAVFIETKNWANDSKFHDNISLNADSKVFGDWLSSVSN